VSARLQSPCAYRAQPPEPEALNERRRSRNRLRLELVSPAARCTGKPPASWGGKVSALRWLASGGHAAVFGRCEAPCPLDRVELFRDTVLRRYGGQLYIMDNPEKGSASYARPVASEADVEARYAVEVGAWTEDQFGPCAPVKRVALEAAPSALRGPSR
jgi:hypothetical protein